MRIAHWLPEDRVERGRFQTIRNLSRDTYPQILLANLWIFRQSAAQATDAKGDLVDRAPQVNDATSIGTCAVPVPCPFHDRPRSVGS